MARCGAALGVIAAGFASAVPKASAANALRDVPDRTWQTDNRVRVILFTQDRMYLAGQFTKLRPPGASKGVLTRNFVAAFDRRTGNPITSFNAVADAQVRSMERRHVAVVSALGRGELGSWNPGADTAQGVWTLEASGTGVFVGGEFTRTGGRDQQGFAFYSGRP
ncbi:MAG: hypothetical protein ACREJP_01965 [Candidatus Methylomirabilales bacterium]